MKWEPSTHKCYFCGALVGSRVEFINNHGEAFKYLPKYEHAHMECYIERCAREVIKSDKEYFRERFTKVIDEYFCDVETNKEELINDLMKCFDEEE
jgi:hypothetical protein